MGRHGGRVSGPTRTLLVLGALFVTVALFLATANAGPANQPDPRNASDGLIFRGNPDKDCLKCHRSWGMKDTHYILAALPKEIKKGEQTNLEIRVENAWNYEVAALRVDLNLTNPGDPETYVASLAGSAALPEPPFAQAWYGALANPRTPKEAAAVPGTPVNSSIDIPFEVKRGAVSLKADLNLYYPAGTGTPGVENRLDATLVPPGRTTGYPWEANQDPRATEHHAQLPRGTGRATVDATEGTWKLHLAFSNGDAPSVDYAAQVHIDYGVVGEGMFKVYERERAPADPAKAPAAVIPANGVSNVIEIPIQGIKEGTQHIDLKVTALLYYKHDSGATPDEEVYERFFSGDILVGDRYVGSGAVEASGGGKEVQADLVIAEVTGFSAAVLLIPSLILGGTYGKGSRQFLNNVLGGAKRRVMFHNLASLGLTLVALVHIVLFLLEARYTVLMGLLYGGISTVSLLVLGLTGYYQVPLIQKHGYAWWRTVHLVFGVLVVVAVAYHSVADGADFGFIKRQLPQWLNDLNLADR